MNQPNKNFVNQILCCDCVDGMKRLLDDCIDLTVTSPPYGKMRDYGGQEFTHEKFQAIARELFRITKPGGVVVWVVRDQILPKEGESGESSRQRLSFKEAGFRLHHTMVMDRTGCRWPRQCRYGEALEYAFVLSKGRPGCVNLVKFRENKHPGKTSSLTRRALNGSVKTVSKPQTVELLGVEGAVWTYTVGRGSTTQDHDALSAHPALMPEQMAKDHILSWSRPGELVFDPMAGGGTTCKMALLNNRRYLGFEVHPPYHLAAMRRLKRAHQQYRERLDDWLIDRQDIRQVLLGA